MTTDLAILPVQILPYKIQPVDLAMVQIESRFQWAEEVATGITA
jgi:hypothetical protein